jgi:lipoate-protein ligase A
MSVDEALLVRAAAGPPTLRLYTWTTPSVSLGYRQPEPEWRESPDALGVALVRRVTGGGAVLHAGDLTYAVVAPHWTPGVPDDLESSYRMIRAAVLEALRALQLQATAAAGMAPPARARPAAADPVCFSHTTGLEIELEGRKLVGSAQRRTRLGFLQHGSIRLSDDRVLNRALFGQELPAPPASLAGLCPASVAAAIERAFCEALPEPVRRGAMSPEELAIARERAAARAADPLWARGMAPTVSSRSEASPADTAA